MQEVYAQKLPLIIPQMYLCLPFLLLSLRVWVELHSVHCITKPLYSSSLVREDREGRTAGVPVIVPTVNAG